MRVSGLASELTTKRSSKVGLGVEGSGFACKVYVLPFWDSGLSPCLCTKIVLCGLRILGLGPDLKCKQCTL